DQRSAVRDVIQQPLVRAGKLRAQLVSSDSDNDGAEAGQITKSQLFCIQHVHLDAQTPQRIRYGLALGSDVTHAKTLRYHHAKRVHRTLRRLAPKLRRKTGQRLQRLREPLSLCVARVLRRSLRVGRNSVASRG